MVPIQAPNLGRRTGCWRRYPGGTEYRSIFRTVSRANPNILAASRSLILSTITARRTRAYNSTVYTSPVFHKHVRDVCWNQFPGGLVSRRRYAVHAAFTGLVCHWRVYPPNFRVVQNAAVAYYYGQRAKPSPLDYEGLVLKAGKGAPRKFVQEGLSPASVNERHL